LTKLSALAVSFEVMELERIEAMSGQQCADALVAEVARERAAGARRLLLIGQWAVLHNGDSVERRYDASGEILPGTEQARTYGGDGTPEVAEFAVHELALLLGLPETVARNELADVLDLQHRHPLLWARVQETAGCDAEGRDPALAAGMVQAWQATYVARRCHHAKLSLEAARWVDERTADDLGRQAWSRFQDTLDARIKEADPALAEQKRREKEASKRVTVSQTNSDGMKSLTVTLPAAQIILMRARIHQVAKILQAHGAQAALGQLEADAAFLLATNPLEALLMLIDAATKAPAACPSGGPAASATPHPTPEQDPDDPVGLFDDRPVSGREGSRPWSEPPTPETPPDPEHQSDAVPESALHPSRRDDTCPTCGHDPTHAPQVRAALTRADLPDLDAARLRPSAVLYLHASEAEFRSGAGVVRFENDGTAFTRREAIDLLGHCNVTIRRVIDLNEHHPVDGYEVPDRLAEQVRLTHPTSVFPFAATSSRSSGIDLDHARPYVPPSAGGPPGQTSLQNLAPLGRGSHRVKTHGRGWATRHPRFGMHLWRTPHGYCFQCDPSGTTPLGRMTHEEFDQYSRELAEQLSWDEPVDAPVEGAVA
jgi:hypothetical protein